MPLRTARAGQLSQYSDHAMERTSKKVSFDPRQGLEHHLFSKSFSSALGLNQPPVQFVQRVLYGEVKQPGCKLNPPIV